MTPEVAALAAALPKAINFRFLPPRVVTDPIWQEIAVELAAALPDAVPDVHVYPVGEGHEMSEDCWCHPKVHPAKPADDVPDAERDTIEHLIVANERLDAAAHAAYDAMDAATRWAAHQRPETDTLAAADEHLKGYDALLDGQVRLGQALGILRRATPTGEER